MDHALDLVRGVWERPAGPSPALEKPALPAAGQSGITAGPGDNEVIVMVASKGTPMWRVVQQIEAAVGEG